MAQPVRNLRSEPILESVVLPPERAYESLMAKQAYSILHFAFTVAPLVAGVDKFFNLLVNWESYLAPQIPQATGLDASTFMMGVGVIEIAAGLGVAFKPRIFGYVVAAWMVGIIVNLVVLGQYYDVALRDLGLAFGAFALARLAKVFDLPREANLRSWQSP